MQTADPIAAAKMAKLTFRSDYAAVREVIAFLTSVRADARPLDGLPDYTGFDAAHAQRILTRWCGLSLKEFARTTTTERVRQLLASSPRVFDPGERGEGQIHGFTVATMRISGSDARRSGAGLDIVYGVHESPFGDALVLMTEGGICGMAFFDEDAGETQHGTLDDMVARWPDAHYREAAGETATIATRIFEGRENAKAGETIPVILIGTAFDVLVWEALLRIPMGRVVSYADIARYLGRPTASRAVGTANGRNPISYVVPCHRALRSDGSLGGYYWGLARKRAMISWEAGQKAADLNR